ncbi:[acyl-carrier-protein] S-malonyltransferase [Lentzea fradiae]|uniref:[acyl-carrier-protein] S-malonyltransferase n=1 Tax=Lentzea fradiae TaxID=200378 RepID=A0A1G8CP40_9PSEU|nr:acyltransferase domain-containing protein [Lentzea fradiae]SDH46630.1 [acyl-carrier-protein] S-malonyltransferase [Lentzea fradiae]
MRNGRATSTSGQDPVTGGQAAPVLLFPGQGGYLPGGLRELTDDFAGLPAVLERITAASSAAGGPPVADLLTDRAAPTLRSLAATDPGRLHLAIFATEMCLHEIHTRCWGVTPAALVGHSLGEFAALVAAGSISLETGVHLVVARDEALRSAGPPVGGGMVALRTDRRSADRLLERLSSAGTVLAVDNGADQVVVSGPAGQLLDLAELAAAESVDSVRLDVSYPFHNAMLRDAAERFSAVVGTIDCAAPSLPLLSPVLGRWVERPADVRELLTSHLVRPVGFLDALRTLRAEGHRTFVECTARAVLTTLVRSTEDDPALVPAAAAG